MFTHEPYSRSSTAVCIPHSACAAQPPSASARASRGSGSDCTASLFHVLSFHSTRARPRSPSPAQRWSTASACRVLAVPGQEYTRKEETPLRGHKGVNEAPAAASTVRKVTQTALLAHQ